MDQPASTNVAFHQAQNIANTLAGNRRILGWPCLLTLYLTIVLCDNQLLAQTQAKEAAVPVGTVIAARNPVEKTRDFVGRVEAINRVEVRARVTGYLEAVLFKEGDLVHEGAGLYQIEKGPFEAAVQQAEGNLARRKSAKVLTAAQLGRAQALVPKGDISQAEFDQRRAEDSKVQGEIKTAQGELKTAKINLGYNNITAPITGRIGKTNLTKGNVVGPNSGVLALIVSQDPMHVTFPVSERDFLPYREAGQRVDTSRFRVRIRFADGAQYAHTGKIDFVDVLIDRSADTILVRATFPNPSGALTDDQLVRVTLESVAPVEAVSIPQAALISDQQGVYVFVVKDGKAEVRRVKPGGEIGEIVIIKEGLSGGEQVIVEGLQGVRAGMPVTATPMPITLGRT
jgi:membrane fusion protein (multidrug efflux system)